MTLYNIFGRLVHKNVSKFLIDWDKKSRSKPQFEVKTFLKPYWHPYIVYEEFPVYGSLLKVDILNASLKIAVEVHGPQHDDMHFFHGGSPAKRLKAIKNDMAKSDWLLKNGFKIVEIYWNEVKTLTPQIFAEKYGITL